MSSSTLSHKLPSGLCSPLRLQGLSPELLYSKISVSQGAPVTQWMGILRMVAEVAALGEARTTAVETGWGRGELRCAFFFFSGE